MGRKLNERKDIAALWHPELNVDHDFSLIALNSNHKFWWLGECGHEWQRAASDMNRKTTACPYCSGKSVLEGFNDLATTHPQIAAQWHPEKNNVLRPEVIMSGSHSKAWWLGECGHSWEAKIENRTRSGHGCPYCAGQKVLQGFNDLTTTHPEIASVWHPTKNESAPTQFTAGSHQKVWWLGSCGHEWDMQIQNHALQKQGCPYCANRKVLPGFNDIKTTAPKLSVDLHHTLNADTDTSALMKSSGKKVWWQCPKDESHVWYMRVNDRYSNKQNCPVCAAANYVSRAEEDLSSFLSTFVTVEKSHRKIIHPYEIDIYIPSKQIGIEFNGLYWHSELKGKTRAYHHSKWLAAKKAGIQLIQIWEDDWNRNPELVKRMLSHKLGVSQEKTVYARKTQVDNITLQEMRAFLEANHIQGHSNGSYYLGLRDKENNEIVAVLVLKKEPGTDGRTLNIIRYATSVNVVGGFTKLLTHAERTYTPEKFITFADHTVSDGGLYEKNGFIAEKELDPDYMYVVKGERKHKFGYRLKRFRNDPELKFEEGLTERELAELNKIPRIWDAGKTRYVKHM